MKSTYSRPRSSIASFLSVAALLFAGIVIASSGAWADSLLSDEEQISRLIKTTWEKPDHPMSVAPITVSGTYAVAGWAETARGGRALLKKGDGKWSVVLCAGDGIRTEAGLAAAGIPPETAKALATEIAQEEAKLPSDQVAKFSLFEGEVHMDAGQHHPHH